MQTVDIELGTQGLSTLTVNGVSMLLQPNAPPDLIQVATVDAHGTHYTESATPISSTVSGDSVVQVYPWGFMVTRYDGGDSLAIEVSITNTSEDRTIDHIWFHAAGLKLPAVPVNYDPSFCATSNIDAPSSLWWDYGTGTLDLVNEDVTKPLMLAWWKASSADLSKQLVSLNSDSAQTVSSSWPPTPRPIPPGQSDTWNVSIRFGGPGDQEIYLAGDIFESYAQRFPRRIEAPVNRPIAAINSTSAHFVDGVRVPYDTNPRGWWNDPNVDVTTPEGIAAFQQRFLGFADTCIAEITRVGGMGAIFWDLEGQQYDAAYIGDPSQIERIAPELVGVLDAFLSRFQDAGLEIGFCIRPQYFNSASLKQINTGHPGDILFHKIKYCVERWGATLFYVDSNLNDAGVLNRAVSYEALHLAFPNVLIFPEWEATRYYAYTLPYNNAVNKIFGAPQAACMVYPDAVGLLKVTDPSVASNPDEITAAAQAGNILLYDGWYRNPASDFVKQVYDDME